MNFSGKLRSSFSGFGNFIRAGNNPMGDEHVYAVSYLIIPMEVKIDANRNSFVNFYRNEEEIQTLVDRFRDRTLPASKWTHAAHIVTGLWFAYRYNALETICYLRSGIIAYNISTGGENSPERGYHETLTQFWCRILHDFVTKNQSLTQNCAIVS